MSLQCVIWCDCMSKFHFHVLLCAAVTCSVAYITILKCRLSMVLVWCAVPLLVQMLFSCWHSRIAVLMVWLQSAVPGMISECHFYTIFDTIPKCHSWYHFEVPFLLCFYQKLLSDAPIKRFTYHYDGCIHKSMYR